MEPAIPPPTLIERQFAIDQLALHVAVFGKIGALLVFADDVHLHAKAGEIGGQLRCAADLPVDATRRLVHRGIRNIGVRQNPDPANRELFAVEALPRRIKPLNRLSA